jgi:hypothetical protein
LPSDDRSRVPDHEVTTVKVEGQRRRDLVGEQPGQLGDDRSFVGEQLCIEPGLEIHQSSRSLRPHHTGQLPADYRLDRTDDRCAVRAHGGAQPFLGFGMPAAIHPRHALVPGTGREIDKHRSGVGLAINCADIGGSDPGHRVGEFSVVPRGEEQRDRLRGCRLVDGLADAAQQIGPMVPRRRHAGPASE